VPDIVTIEIADGPIEHYLLGSGGLAEVKDGAMTIIAGKARRLEAPETQGGVTDLATARRRTKDVQTSWASAVCPATDRRAHIKLVQNGTSRVVACSNWPERQGCDQACLSHPQ
jgi:F0F1-type ATP synthase epsilon subunit